MCRGSVRLFILSTDVSILCLFSTGHPGGLCLRLSIGGCFMLNFTVDARMFCVLDVDKQEPVAQ